MSDQPIETTPNHEVETGMRLRTHDECVRRAFFVFAANATAPVLLGSGVSYFLASTSAVGHAEVKDLCLLGLVTVPAIAFIGCVLESVFFVEAIWADNPSGIDGALGPAMWLMLTILCAPSLFVAIPFYFGALHRKTALLANRPRWDFLFVHSTIVCALTGFLLTNLISMKVWVTMLILLSPFVSDIIMTNWVLEYRRLQLLAKPARKNFQFSLRTLLFFIWMAGAYVTAFIILLRE